MKKIPTIFKRDENNRGLVTSEINPACLWVFYGEGVATRKYDGSCCMIHDGKLYKRREFKDGKPEPDNFIECEYDEVTGKHFGWIPVLDNAKEDQYFVEAYRKLPSPAINGTYELVGPKVQGNPEKCDRHILLAHNSAFEYRYILDRSFKGLKEWMEKVDIEGLVFHHPDGRMAKIKKRDFGLKR